MSETSLHTIVSKFDFKRRLRITRPTEFQHVFAKPVKTGSAAFTVLAIGNTLQHPRLGLAIAKKHLRRAVDRNRIKRQIRESFRLHQHILPGIDVVVLANAQTNKKNNTELAIALKNHWQKLVKQCTKFS